MQAQVSERSADPLGITQGCGYLGLIEVAEGPLVVGEKLPNGSLLPGTVSDFHGQGTVKCCRKVKR